MNLRSLIINIIDIYVIIIIVRALLSWFQINQYSSFFRIYLFLIKITEPILSKFRELQLRFFPHSPIDFSPIIALLILNLLRNLIRGA